MLPGLAASLPAPTRRERGFIAARQRRTEIAIYQPTSNPGGHRLRALQCQSGATFTSAVERRAPNELPGPSRGSFRDIWFSKCLHAWFESGEGTLAVYLYLGGHRRPQGAPTPCIPRDDRNHVERRAGGFLQGGRRSPGDRSPSGACHLSHRGVGLPSANAFGACPLALLQPSTRTPAT
jgi:hypothetical protein